jgi:hypothetical protein
MAIQLRISSVEIVTDFVLQGLEKVTEAAVAEHFIQQFPRHAVLRFELADPLSHHSNVIRRRGFFDISQRGIGAPHSRLVVAQVFRVHFGNSVR